jgi:HSP20 family protein
MVRREDEKDVVPRDYWSLSILDEMERAFADFRMGMRDFWLPSISSKGFRVPAVDFKDAGSEYIVEVELPGMSKEDVVIEIVKDGLMVSARKEEIKEEKGEGFIRRERGHLSFKRRLLLPGNSDTEAIEAKIVDGVLHLSVPKKEKADDEKRTVEVK